MCYWLSVRFLYTNSKPKTLTLGLDLVINIFLILSVENYICWWFLTSFSPKLIPANTIPFDITIISKLTLLSLKSCQLLITTKLYSNLLIQLILPTLMYILLHSYIHQILTKTLANLNQPTFLYLPTRPILLYNFPYIKFITSSL